MKNLSEVDFLFPKNIDIESFSIKPSLEPFSDEIVNYLNALSKVLNKDPRTKIYPDVATFGFFCRKANIIFLKKKYKTEGIMRLGRGIVFHIAPSNVAVNFAYSLLSGLLAGNLNIVRVPSKNFEQVHIICEAIKKLNKEPKYKSLSAYISLVRYNRMNSATKYFSSICDVRIIWGGNQTIEQIRENKIPSQSFDLTFADRYSLCTINANKYVKEKLLDKIAQAFYNDTYLFDQNACTSPHLLIWLGSNKNVKKAKRIFWDTLYKFIKSKYIIQPVIAVDKLTSFYNQSAHINKAKKIVSSDNLIWRIELENLPKNIDEFSCTSGYFSEYHATSLSEIRKIINRKYQTLSYYGFSKKKLNNLIKKIKPSGIDRIVPIGKTSEFSLIWDGFDLIEILSRRVDIQG